MEQKIEEAQTAPNELMLEAKYKQTRPDLTV